MFYVIFYFHCVKLNLSLNVLCFLRLLSCEVRSHSASRPVSTQEPVPVKFEVILRAEEKYLYCILSTDVLLIISRLIWVSVNRPLT